MGLMAKMTNALLARIGGALTELDLGISQQQLKRDPLQALNRALREVGGARITDMENPAALRRAANTLEGAVDAV